MSSRKNSASQDTLFAQAGGAIDPQNGGVVPPIQSSTTFVRDENYDPISPDNIYARDQNDLVRLGESLISSSCNCLQARRHLCWHWLWSAGPGGSD